MHLVGFYYKNWYSTLFRLQQTYTQNWCYRLFRLHQTYTQNGYYRLFRLQQTYTQNWCYRLFRLQQTYTQNWCYHLFRLQQTYTQKQTSLLLFITVGSSKCNDHSTAVLACLYRVTTVRPIETTTCEPIGHEDRLDKTKIKLSLSLSTTI